VRYSRRDAIAGSRFESNSSIEDSLIRVSVGIEEVDDLLEDLDSALDKAR
jgi:cystathionine beta-lyase/cystathionine gamma-synthase